MINKQSANNSNENKNAANKKSDAKTSLELVAGLGLEPRTFGL